MNISKSHKITATLASALQSGDVAAMRSAVLYPDTLTVRSEGAAAEMALLEALRHGFPMPGGDPDKNTASFIDVCHARGRLDMLGLMLGADHLSSAFFSPEKSLEASRRGWVVRLQSHLSNGFIAFSNPLEAAIRTPQPHSVDLIRMLVDFQEPDWLGVEAEGPGNAMLGEAKMRIHIDARLAEHQAERAAGFETGAGATDATAAGVQSAPPAVLNAQPHVERRRARTL